MSTINPRSVLKATLVTFRDANLTRASIDQLVRLAGEEFPGTSFATAGTFKL